MNAAVFLDRDNTLIHNDGDLGDPDQVQLIQGAASAIASLRGLGYRIIVVTNQGGVARGKYTEADVQAVHERLNEMVNKFSGAKIDRFYYCPYHPEGNVARYRREHPWRKPKPGMLQQAAQDMDIDLSQSWMIGDQPRDVEAGAAAGTRTILLRADAPELKPLRSDEITSFQIEPTGEDGQPQAAEGGQSKPHFTARSLVEAVRIVAQQRRPDAGDAPQAKRWESNVPRKPAERSPEGSGTVTAVQSPPAATPVSAHRPFRPWNAPDTDGEDDAPATGAQVKVAPAAAQPSPAQSQPPAPQAAPSPPAASDHDAAPATPRQDASRDVAERTAPAGATDGMTPSTEPVLRQILQELRNQRAELNDFSYLRMFATVLQIIAVVCLLAGLFLAGDDTAQFLRWFAASLIAQLMTIAALLSSR